MLACFFASPSDRHYPGMPVVDVDFATELARISARSYALSYTA